ncbi:hypothetical protein B0J11DRAFT_513781 [Dendryphion nanum]|uniref:Uncharacterized protein n=1 Tax=Dendryphion nanum TaxID=256645 RepID=A0A9P9EIC3_9PLEO|nr:hypothetical protein B0J11DRAFT_513781 [Dendryphion nanum]
MLYQRLLTHSKDYPWADLHVRKYDFKKAELRSYIISSTMHLLGSLLVVSCADHPLYLANYVFHVVTLKSSYVEFFVFILLLRGSSC